MFIIIISKVVCFEGPTTKTKNNQQEQGLKERTKLTIYV